MIEIQLVPIDDVREGDDGVGQHGQHGHGSRISPYTREEEEEYQNGVHAAHNVQSATKASSEHTPRDDRLVEKAVEIFRGRVVRDGRKESGAHQ